MHKSFGANKTSCPFHLLSYVRRHRHGLPTPTDSVTHSPVAAFPPPLVSGSRLHNPPSSPPHPQQPTLPVATGEAPPWFLLSPHASDQQRRRCGCGFTSA